MSGALITYVAASVPFDGTEKTDGTPVSPPFVSENARDGIIEARETASGTASRYVAISGFNGDANSGRWLEFFSHNRSDEAPLVIAENSTILSMSLSTKDNSTGTANVLVNGTGVGIITITAAKSTYLNGLSIPLTPGDLISVQVGSGSLKKRCLFSLFIRTEGI